MTHRGAQLVVVLAAMLLSLQTAVPAPARAYRIIVNPANPTAAIPRSFLAHAFLKKVTEWPDGEQIRPVDLAPDSTVRRRFAEDVLNRSISAVKSYWQQLIFSGRSLPPPELDSEQAVIRYVLRNRGAIGYLAGDSETGGAKVVVVEE